MDNHTVWNEKSEQLLKYFYDDLKICNWSTIAKEISSRMEANYSEDACRNRYIAISPPIKKQQWAPEEQQQLYRLHNENGNKWAVIAQSLLGRTDNCVKNHFYSKLRKSLRTLNKIGKLYLKKIVKEVSTTVLYKLTQATDQSLKSNPEITQQLVELCFDIKHRLLNYDMDQKDIKEGLDYLFQKNLLIDLTRFSRVYKKKSKKEKNSAMGSQNLKKLHEKKRREKQFKIISQNIFDNPYQNPSEDPQEPQTPHSNRQFSEASSVLPKMAKTVVLKAPALNPNKIINNQPQQLRAFEPYSPLFPKEIKKSSKPIQPANQPSQNPNLNEVEAILRGEGVLEQNEDTENNKALSFFRRQASNRSFSSVQSQSGRSGQEQSSNLDMFGDDFLMNSRFKQLSEMESDNHIFGYQSQNFHN